MELDEVKVKTLFTNLYSLQTDCRFVCAPLQKNSTLYGLKTLTHIVGHRNWDLVATNTQLFEDDPKQIQNALNSIQRLRRNYLAVSDSLDYFEGLLKKISE